MGTVDYEMLSPGDRDGIVPEVLTGSHTEQLPPAVLEQLRQAQAEGLGEFSVQLPASEALNILQPQRH